MSKRLDVRVQPLMVFFRAGDGIRTREMVAWKATALPLGDSRVYYRQT